MRKSSFFLYICLVLGFTAISLEVATRLLYPKANFLFLEYYKEGFVFSKSNFSDYVSIFPPDYTEMQEYQMHLETNSFGHRAERDYAFEKPENTFRIFSMGGSINLGWPFPPQEGYLKLLEGKIKNSQVINASMIGTGAANLHKYYRKLGHKFEADVVTLQLRPARPWVDDLILNELGQYPFETAAMRKLGHGKWMWKNRGTDVAGKLTLPMNEFPDYQKLVGDINRSFLLFYSPIAQFFYDHSQAFRLVNRRLRAIRHPVFRAYLNDYAGQLPQSNYYSTFQYIKVIAQMVKEKGRRFMVMVLPNRHGCEKKSWQQWELLLGKLRLEKIQVANFIDDLCDREKHKPRDNVYLEKEVHFKKHIHADVADKTYRMMKILNWLPTK